jgi:hypothetical protein
VAAPGETDLAEMLATLRVVRREGTFTMGESDDAPAAVVARAHARIDEEESTTYVVEVADAVAAGWEVPVEMAWLTLAVHSSLEAVGLTAHVSGVLAQEDIPCNVLAGYHHDHLLVPLDRADRAIELLTAAR